MIEEVFPGFRFSVCSSVVSLLRPEIICERELPRRISAIAFAYSLWTESWPQRT